MPAALSQKQPAPKLPKCRLLFVAELPRRHGLARPCKPKKAACTQTAEVQAAFVPRFTLIGYNKPRPALHLGRIPYIVKTGAIAEILKLAEQNVHGKTVLIRADLNVPLKEGKISDDTRIRASLPSIQYCLENGAGVIVMSHLSRPTERRVQTRGTMSRPWPNVWARCWAKTSACWTTGRPIRPVAADEVVTCCKTCALTKAKRKTAPNWAKPMPPCATCS